MSNVAAIAQQGANSERELHGVLDEIERRNHATRTASSLADELEAAAADGVVDANELARLQSLAAELGVDLGLDGSEISGSALDDLRAEVAGVVRDVQRNSGPSHLLDVKRNLLISEISRHYQAASNVAQIEHQTAMNIIGNLKA